MHKLTLLTGFLILVWGLAQNLPVPPQVDAAIQETIALTTTGSQSLICANPEVWAVEQGSAPNLITAGVAILQPIARERNWGYINQLKLPSGGWVVFLDPDPSSQTAYVVGGVVQGPEAGKGWAFLVRCTLGTAGAKASA